MCQELKYLGCVLDDSATDIAIVVGRWRVGRKWQALSGSWLMLGVCSLSGRGLHEALFVLVPCHGRDTMIGREKEGLPKIRSVQMDNLIGMLGIRRMDRAPNARKNYVECRRGRIKGLVIVFSGGSVILGE